MSMSKWVYILIGDNNTGKTTFQKRLLQHLCHEDRDTRLHVNLTFPVRHPNAPSQLEWASFGSRSYQEKETVYESVQNYFKEYFKPADVCFLASHLVVEDIKEMINECHKQQFNVGGIFWSNSIQSSPSENQEIALLEWDERFLLKNPLCTDVDAQKRQIDQLAVDFADMIVSRAALW